MEHLFLSCASQRMQWGERSFQSPSRFLQEIPDEWIETLGATQRGPRSRTASPRSGSQFDYSYGQDVPTDDGPGEDGVAVGTMVRHPVFGRGQVLAVIGTDLNQKLRIKFERAGVKTVMVRFANLELA
jgi:DNA helicase-2/ATP-dependent DNA helicase PcrA